MTWKIGEAPYPAARAAKGPTYKVGPYCAMPTCNQPADHAHHLWSRSHMTGPFNWVEVEKVVYPNLLPLCWKHHEDVTGDVRGHRAGIRFEPESGILYWVDGNGESELVWGASTFPAPELPDLCSECGRRKPRKYTIPLDDAARTARPKTRLVLMVPVDERENGVANILDLLSQCAELFGRTENEKYYTLTESLTHVALHYDPEAEEYTGEGPCPTCGRTPVWTST